MSLSAQLPIANVALSSIGAVKDRNVEVGFCIDAADSNGMRS